MTRFASLQPLLGGAELARIEGPALPRDPLESPMWAYHAKRLFDDAPVRFEPLVRLLMPGIAENQRVFPVTVDARALAGVERIVLFADLNPIPVALDYRPLAAAAFIATRIKLDQRTPVRAAVRTQDGTWHLAGDWIDAAGGGCSAPPVSRVKGDWAEHLGEMRGRTWPQGTDTRLRLAFRHPMDTGLVENIPAYHLETLQVAGSDGRPLARLTLAGSVSEDPVVTLLVTGQDSAYAIAARDTSGLEFTATLAGARA